MEHNTFDFEISFLKKQSFKQDSLDLLSSFDDINSVVTDFFSDVCIIDFTKSTNINIMHNKNLSITDSQATIITNLITPHKEKESLFNICCKVYREEFPGTIINTSIITNDNKEYPIKLINSNSFGLLDTKVDSFRLKIQIDIPQFSHSPNIFGYSIFYNDTSIF